MTRPTALWDSDPLGDVPGLVMAWCRGWAICRRVPEPLPVPGGMRIDVGLPGHRVRFVLHSWDAERLQHLDAGPAAPGTWIKVAGQTTELSRVLPARWTVARSALLMSCRFERGTTGPHPPYELRLMKQGDVVIATAVDPTGAVASSARLGPVGRYGVIDQVETAPDHRRRGLGTAVMRALSDHAASMGLTTGVLGATEEGRRLYGGLGWTTLSELAAAYIPEPPFALGPQRTP